MLKKSASSVLAALAAAMKHETKANRGAAALPAERRILARRGRVGEKSGLFEHSVGGFSHYAQMQAIEVLAYQNSFSAAC